MPVGPAAVCGLTPSLHRLASMFEPPKFQMPEIKPIPQAFFEKLVSHVQSQEAQLGDGEQLAFVHGQTGEPIFVHNIRYDGMAVILEGEDSNGVKTSVFANMMSIQIAFKVLSSDSKATPIGFSSNTAV